MAPSGEGEETPGESRDLRRLMVGLLFMGAMLGVTLAAAFFMGNPVPGADVASGVPFLAASCAALIVGAAAVFYRTYRGQ